MVLQKPVYRGNVNLEWYGTIMLIERPGDNPIIKKANHVSSANGEWEEVLEEKWRVQVEHVMSKILRR